MHTLIIAEKPSAAKKIADALAEGAVREMGAAVKAYKIKRAGKELIIAPAAGHLFLLAEAGKSSWSYPVFSVEWKPIFKVPGHAWAKKYSDGLAALAKGASGFVSACDYDIEGSTLAYNILRFICKSERAKRMRFSTLTKPDLIEAYESASPELDFPQIEAGLARHALDYFWGINVSRGLTLSLKAAGGYKTLSAGRVQGPALALVAQREQEIARFQPRPYWELQLAGLLHGQQIAALHEAGKFWEEPRAALERAQAAEPLVRSVSSAQARIPPPPAFDLTTLQRQAYAFLSLSPKQTLDIAQRLYEAALISYPRTASQQLPERIGYAGIISELAKQRKYEPLCTELLQKPLDPIQGKKTDPAHPAIYPTGAKPRKLTELELKLYDLIARRFLAAFAGPALRETARIAIAAGPELFIATGARTLEQHWIRFAGPFVRFKEQPLPPAAAGDRIERPEFAMPAKQTQPPPRYTEASLLKEMETLNLGTKATRALILQTLYDRGYIRDRSIELTELGTAVAGALGKFCPEILAAELTRQFEAALEQIQSGAAQREAVLAEAQAVLTKLLTRFKQHEAAIGQELLAGVRAALAAESQLGPCPACGQLLVIRRSKFGKLFIGCLGYPTCTQTYSLPQKGKLHLLPETCAHALPDGRPCSLRFVQIQQPGKRPWQLCVQHGFARRPAASGASAPADDRE